MSKMQLLALAGVIATLGCATAMKPGATSTVTPSGGINSSKTSSATRSAPGQQVNIPRVYQETCAKCHGGRAEGGGGGTPRLVSWEKFDQKQDKPFFEIIKNGHKEGGMDAYGQTMSDPEIWGLVVYLRELQGQELRKEFGSPTANNGVYTSKYAKYRVETVVDSGIRTPWSMAWLPDGRMLVTSRSGTLHVRDQNGKEGIVENVTQSLEVGQGGLMEVSTHPKYAQNGWVYLSVADPAKSGARSAMTKIVRGKLAGTGTSLSWTSEQTIFENPQDTYNGSGVHFGGKIIFNNKGQLFFSIGERGNQDLAQDLAKPNGKIYRVNDDGTIPSDNPFNTPSDKAKGISPAVWSYGHRNPQGLTIDLEGDLWDTEHGPRGGDEINRVEKAANYGWPVRAFSINYNGAPLSTPWPAPSEKIKLPAYRWLPSVGASGLDVMKGASFPGWKGDLIAGGLSGSNVERFRMKNGVLVEKEELLHGMGRVRDIRVGPDGLLYVALNGPDKIIRIVPAK